MRNHRITELLNHRIPYSVILLFSYSVIASAAVPLSWTVETSRAQPATFEAYQGETLTFEAALQSHGKPLEAPLNYSFFWQTNGMGSTYWEAPCKSGEAESFPLQNQSTNVLFATWLPAYDVGAKVYNCFIGSPSNIYHAAFQLRLRPSPGATPNALPLPTPVIDFAHVRVLNPPWEGGGGGGVDTNTVEWIANRAVETNALVVATTNRVAALETATNNLTSSVSRLQSSKLDKGNMVVTNGGTQFRLENDDSAGVVLDARAGVQGKWVKDFDGNDLSSKADRSMISAADETFSNEVATVAKTVQPTTVRAYDSVRRCWWVLEIVNGVPTWIVED